MKRVEGLLAVAVALALTAGVAWGHVEVEWEKGFGGYNDETCSAMIQTSSGGYAITGYTTSYGAGAKDVWLVVTDSDGDLIFSQTYGGSEDDSGTDIIESHDGSFYIAGYTASGGYASTRTWLLKVDREGGLIWEDFFNNRPENGVEALALTSDEGCVLAGVAGEAWDQSRRCFIAKFDSDGRREWNQGIRIHAYSLDLIKVSDGYIMTTDWCGIFKYSERGDSLWNNSHDVDFPNVAHAISNGTFITAGSLIFDMEAGVSKYTFNRFNARGNGLISRSYAMDRGQPWAITNTADSGFVMVGSVNGFRVCLLRIDNEGDSLWASELDYDYFQPAKGVVQTDDCGFVFTGETNGDFYLVKTTPDPASVREPQAIAPFALHLAQPFPNPFNSTVTIPFSFSPINREATGGVRMAIFDPLGRRVAELIPDGSGELIRRYGGNLGKHSVVWDANGMPAGQYIVRLEAGNQQLSQRLSLVK